MKFVHAHCPDFGSLLIRLFNVMLSKRMYPKCWTSGVIKNLFKGKGSPCDPSNYRAITLMPSLSKLYTKVLSERLWQWIGENGIVNEAQAGFRKEYGTMDNVLVLKTIMDKSLAMKRSKLYLCFVDFEKAFDKIDRRLLWTKLTKIGVPFQLLETIRSIYESTVCCIRSSSDHISTEFQTYQGLGQGCHLSALLFLLYINDIYEWMDEVHTTSPSIKGKEIKVLLYADDIVFLIKNNWGYAENFKFSGRLLWEVEAVRECD